MKRLTLAATLVTCSLFTVGFAQAKSHSTQTESANYPQREMSESLSADYAAFRKKQISNVTYGLHLTFDKTHTEFKGQTKIGFNLINSFNQPITLDFEQGKISNITVNGKPVKWQFEKWFISLSPNYFKPGANTIIVDYQRPYSTDGSGLHRFVDPEDQQVYLYSDFEPYDANRLFPHFDQPDLKARFYSTVIAPKDWQVISTTKEVATEIRGEQQIWHFPKSKPISSYVYAMHAGPYHMWQDKFESIPLRLFARQSIAKYVKPEDWFKPTKQSFAFFNHYFETYYPFGKYDQIMAPDYNSGAMENVAAVTFNESYVSRGEKSIARKRSLANTIAHEMAHMWFGDLVTMRWWNGLWLNESFATYMANLALAKASDFDNIWDNFYSGTKQWAYFTDQSVNTHAIELPVKNTAEAFSNFDGITYGKGASVLKQIPYLLGEENFRKGVANYLKKYAYSNTTLADFMGELGKAANRDLTKWTQQWLYHAGTNTIKAQFQCTNGKISQFEIVQTAPKQYPTLREQRVKVGLYQVKNGEVNLSQAIPIIYKGKSTKVAEAIGQSCPDLVYPNADDWGFVKVELDKKSLTTLQQHISQVKNDTLRLMLWQSVWDSVFDNKTPVTQYVDFALANLAREHNLTIIRNVTRGLRSANYFLQVAEQQGKNVAKWRKEIEQFSWQQLIKAKPKSELQKIWYSNFTGNAHTQTALKHVQQLLNGELTIDGLTLDQDKRWGLVYMLNKYQFGDYKALLAKEAKRDPSDSGVKSALVAEAVRPDPKVKAKWFEIVLHNPDNLKLSTLRSVMFSLFPSSQSELFKPYQDKVLAEIPRLNKEADLGYLRAFASAFVPGNCTAESVALLERAVKNFAGMKPQIVKAYKGALQNDQRCVKKLALIK